jgi:hypothetical protein
MRAIVAISVSGNACDAIKHVSRLERRYRLGLCVSIPITTPYFAEAFSKNGLTVIGRYGGLVTIKSCHCTRVKANRKFVNRAENLLSPSTDEQAISI